MRAARGKGVPVGKKSHRGRRKGEEGKKIWKERNSTLNILAQFSGVGCAVCVYLCEYVWVSDTRSSLRLAAQLFFFFVLLRGFEDFHFWGIMVIFFQTGLDKFCGTTRGFDMPCTFLAEE